MVNIYNSPYRNCCILPVYLLGRHTVMKNEVKQLYIYKSALCPRCHNVIKKVKELTKNEPDLELIFIDVLRFPRKALAENITMIPTLQTMNKEKLSGILLSRQQIQTFFKEQRLITD